MTQEAFQQAFTEHFKARHGIEHLEALTELQAGNLRYGLSTNERARELIAKLEQICEVDWRSTRFLDVGCAYGGTCIEAAKLGAKATGIDVAEAYLELARINADGLDLDISFHLLDATDRRIRTVIPAHTVDLVLLNDALEHIYDTAGLLANLSYAMAPGGTLVFAIPNGHHLKYVLKEGHTKGFGLTLMNPFGWKLHPRSSTNIYYRRWGHYVALFNHFGFEPYARLDPLLPSESADVKKQIRTLLAMIQQRSTDYSTDGLDPSYLPAFRRELAKFELEVRMDLESMSPIELEWKYLTAFWKGVARFEPRETTLATSALAPPPAESEPGSGARAKVRKLLRNPHAFLADSRIAPLRPLRHLFPKRRSRAPSRGDEV